MKNLKIILIVFVITLITNNLFAQGVYFNVNAGYGFGMSSQNLLNNSTFTTIEDNSGSGIHENSSSGTIENVKVSLGEGINFGGTFGFMFSENIGAELGISYLLGAKSEGKQEVTHILIDWVGDITTTTKTYTTKLSSKMLRFNPSVVIASGLNSINPYAKFGVIIGMGSYIDEFEHIDSDGNKTIEKWKYFGGVALGLTAGIGANFNLNDNMSLFGEINLVNLSYAPTKGELTEATNNGIDMLPDLSTSEKEKEFVDSDSFDSHNPPSDSEPIKVLKQKFPYGSLGINFGLRVGL